MQNYTFNMDNKLFRICTYINTFSANINARKDRKRERDYTYI